jgi:hypothetical protein
MQSQPMTFGILENRKGVLKAIINDLPEHNQLLFPQATIPT